MWRPWRFGRPAWEGRRAIALIVCIWVLVVLSLLALSFAFRVRLVYKATAYHAKEQELRYLARAAVTQAIAVLAADTNEFDAFTEEWHYPLLRIQGEWLGDVSLQHVRQPVVSCVVVDEESKVNVNLANGAVLTELGIEQDIVSAILDWRDEDDEVTWPGGAESGYYLQREPAYPCKSKPLEVLGELLLIRGVGPQAFLGEDVNRNGILDPGEDVDGNRELQLGLRDLLTVHGDGLINLNTASSVVLGGIPGVTPETAEAFAAHRNSGDSEAGTADDAVLASLEDLGEIPWLSEYDYLRLGEAGKVASEYFLIDATASEDGTYQRVQVEAIVRRTSEGVVVVSWVER